MNPATHGLNDQEAITVRARKRFGQHFLEAAWADKLVAALDPQPQDRFLEIGPGAGALTSRLAPRVAHLTAVEVDRDLARSLADRLPPNVDLIEADFLDLDFSPLVPKRPLRVAGNLPYNISSPILFRLIAAHRESALFRDATLMVQREVADRIVAAPGSGDYGVLTISVQLHADVHRLLTLPPGAFRPPPKVHSAVVRLRFRPPVVALVDEQVFGAMVRSMFTQRRKTLANALGPFAGGRGSDARQALASADIDAARRPETLQLPELARLADYFARNAR
ncbi:MAG: 16S rRNA (adenine(1518)-N(6)/adenine(1519)-N(6))-dimethyltransferase RsmA [Vicinamibacterales bacterium]